MTKENPTVEKVILPWKTECLRLVLIIVITVITSLVVQFCWILHGPAANISKESEVANKVTAETRNFHSQQDQSKQVISEKDEEKEKNQNLHIENSFYDIQMSINSMTEQFGSISDKIKELQSKVNQMDEDAVENLKEKELVLDNVKQLEDNLEKQLENTTAFQERLEKRLNQTFDGVFKNISSLDERIKPVPNLVKSVTALETNKAEIFEKYKNLPKKISDIEMDVKQLKEMLSKLSKENKDRGVTTKSVDFLQICVSMIMFIYIIISTWRGNTSKKEIQLNRFRGRDKKDPTESIPLVISFNEDCLRSHEDLIGGFIGDYYSIVIKNYDDISQIRQIKAKVWFVFVDFNERNIIMEGDSEPVQIKRETVEYIMKMGGTAVVIYHLHPDSRKLQNGHLYSSKLTSIEFHPTLKELSSRDCVLSIDQQFSEYQRSHIRRICNR